MEKSKLKLINAALAGEGLNVHENLVDSDPVLQKALIRLEYHYFKKAISGKYPELYKAVYLSGPRQSEEGFLASIYGRGILVYEFEMPTDVERLVSRKEILSEYLQNAAMEFQEIGVHQDNVILHGGKLYAQTAIIAILYLPKDEPDYENMDIALYQSLIESLQADFITNTETTPEMAAIKMRKMSEDSADSQYQSTKNSNQWRGYGKSNPRRRR